MMFEFMWCFIQSQGHLRIQPNYFMTSLGQKFIYASIFPELVNSMNCLPSPYIRKCLVNMLNL